MYILFDIGGTKTRLAASEDGKHIGEPKIVETPKNFNQGIATFTQIAQELAGGSQIEAVAGGIPGPLNRENKMGFNFPNLPDWNEKPIAEELEKNLRASVYLENDTAVTGLAEAMYGAGKGYEIVVYITVSTGIGGSRITDGRLDENALGFEPGHQIINFTDTQTKCGCGGYAHLEAYASGSAMERRYQTKPREIQDPHIWDETARILAIGLQNTIVHWSPDIVVLGGAMITKTPGISTEQVQQYLKETLTIFPEPPEIAKAKLQDVGGLYGALALLKNNNH